MMEALKQSISTRFTSTRERNPTLSTRRRPAHATWKKRKTVLHHRLQELLVFEIHRNGDREYKNMTLRTLYNYVLAAISSKPSHLIPGERLKDSMLSSVSQSRLGGSMAETASTLGSLNETNVSRRARYNSVANENEAFASSAATNNNAEDSVDTLPQSDDFKRVNFQPQTTSSPRQHRSTASFSLQAQPPLQHVTYRERLGGYFHPRDMRRLVTPFSASNEPELIVRRHVMLLNFDPLRAIVLRDRLLVLVPDGADSILESLANRIKGGMTEMEDSVFGKEHNRSGPMGECQQSAAPETPSDRDDIYNEREVPLHSIRPNASGSKSKRKGPSADANSNNPAPAPAPFRKFERRKSGSPFSSDNDSQTESLDPFDDDEWGDLQGKEWIDLPFELQSVDAVLHTVSLMLTDEANDLQEYAYTAIENLLEPTRTPIAGDSGGGQHDVLRSIKGEISQMTGRLQGFVRAINQVLDEDEDLALMNLSRLITHPERFIQPVSQEVLHEESDEPELILEAYLQQTLSNTNALDLLRQEVAGSEELMNMKLDTVRNRLLYVNTVVSLLTLTVGIGSFIGSIFGMNLLNGLEEDPNAFKNVVLGTCFGALGLLILLVAVFYRAGTLPKVSNEYSLM